MLTINSAGSSCIVPVAITVFGFIKVVVNKITTQDQRVLVGALYVSDVCERCQVHARKIVSGYVDGTVKNTEALLYDHSFLIAYFLIILKRTDVPRGFVGFKILMRRIRLTVDDLEVPSCSFCLC